MTGPALEPAAVAPERNPAALVAEFYPDPALVLTSTGEVRWANEAASRLFGTTVEAFRGNSVLDRIHPDDLQNVALAMTSVYDKDVGTLIEARARTHDGWRLLEVRGAPLGEDLIISIRDLTERHRWEVAGSDTARAQTLLRYGAFVALQLDIAGRVLSSSGAITRLLGHDQALIEGQPFADLIVAQDRATFAACLSTAVAEPHRSTLARPTCEVRLIGFDDAKIHHLVSLVNLLDDPSVGALVLSAQDITGRVEAERELRTSHSLLVSTLEATNEGIVVTNPRGRLTRHNQRFLDIWGLSTDIGHRGDTSEMMDHILPQIANPSSFLARVHEIANSPELEARDTLELRDGRVVERATRPQRVGDRVVGRVFCFRDVSEERRLRNQLSHQAFHDSLTGLANQALFRDRLDHALHCLEAGTGTVAVLFIDLDDFKRVNDSLGHAAGDALLSIMSKRLMSVVRRRDTVARLGGDEFAVLLDAPITLDEARQIADRIVDVARQPVALNETELSCAASVGVVLGAHHDDVDDLLRSADLAMYAAKAQGKGQHQLFAPEMHSSAVRRIELDSSLQRAIRDHELVVHYQPVWTVFDRRVEAVEALVRWQHPQRGLVGPAEFIPHAEQSGMIDLIGEYVLAAACRDLAEWRRALEPSMVPRMSVNLSTRQLLQRSVTERITAILERHDIPANSIILEVTESSLMKDPEMAAQSLQALHDLGVQLAVDDFGTGYSSLAYLQRFPIDFLKIDKTFVDSLIGGQERPLVEAIVQLARTLELTPVAEGVEHDVQMIELEAMGCDLAQGYLLGRPAPAAATLALLEECASQRSSPRSQPTRTA